MKTKLLASLVLVGLWAANASGGDCQSKALAKLKGTWKLVAEEDSGLRKIDRWGVASRLGLALVVGLVVAVPPGGG
jgi:hypothetical protein